MNTLPLLGEKDLLNKDGIVIAEHYVKKKLPETAGKLRIHKSYRYGDTMLTLYRSKDEGRSKKEANIEESSCLSRDV